MPTDSSTKRIRALERGLIVMECLAAKGALGLSDLRKATGLDNATLLRVLATLRDRGWVRRALSEPRYQMTHRAARLLGGTAPGPWIAEVAAPIMARNALLAPWPMELVTDVRPGTIEIVETTRTRGPLSLARSPYGIQPSVVFSAHGRVALAFGTDSRQAAHLAEVCKSGKVEERRFLESGRLTAILAVTREQGFGVREESYWQVPLEETPELAAVAFPVFVNGELTASVSLIWPKDAQSLETLRAEGHLAHLGRTATEIGKAAETSDLRSR